MDSTRIENDALSRSVIGAAIEVHRCLGPGLLESIYERCLEHELTLRGHRIERQRHIPIHYKQIEFAEVLRFDLLVDDRLLVELKCIEEVHSRHKAQVMSYLKLLNIPVGLLINFHERKLVDGVSRLELPT